MDRVAAVAPAVDRDWAASAAAASFLIAHEADRRAEGSDGSEAVDVAQCLVAVKDAVAGHPAGPAIVPDDLDLARTALSLAETAHAVRVVVGRPGGEDEGSDGSILEVRYVFAGPLATGYVTVGSVRRHERARTPREVDVVHPIEATEAATARSRANAYGIAPVLLALLEFDPSSEDCILYMSPRDRSQAAGPVLDPSDSKDLMEGVVTVLVEKAASPRAPEIQKGGASMADFAMSWHYPLAMVDRADL